MALTVTVTQGHAGSTANGLLQRVLVLTNAAAAASQTGAVVTTNHPDTTPFYNRPVTTTVTGSIVYGACGDGATNATFTAGTLTTILTQLQDATNGWAACTWKATSRTGTPGATTLGCSAPTSDTGSWAAAEILAAGGTLTQDPSSPLSSQTTTATTITSPSFTPPSGSLLVTLAAANSNDAALTLAITDTAGLTWRQLVFVNGALFTASAIWVADAPAVKGRNLVVPQAVRRAAFY